MQHGVGGFVAGQRLLRQVLVTLGQTLQLSKPTTTAGTSVNGTHKCQQHIQVSTSHTSVNITHNCQWHIQLSMAHTTVNSTHTNVNSTHIHVSTAHTTVNRNIECQQEQFMVQETMCGNRNDEEQLEVMFTGTTNGNSKFK